MSETMPGIGFEDSGSRLVERIKNEKFGELYEGSVDFIPELRAGVERAFPNEPEAWEMVPAYHELVGSTMKESERRKVTAEAKEYIEAKIGDFLNNFESN